MPTAVVTGGAGFLGSHLCEHLLQAGINADLEVQTRQGPQMAGTLLVQVVNHATEHRAHVCTVLGAHGMQTPPLDPFSYRAAVREGL